MLIKSLLKVNYKQKYEVSIYCRIKTILWKLVIILNVNQIEKIWFYFNPKKILQIKSSFKQVSIFKHNIQNHGMQTG